MWFRVSRLTAIFVVIGAAVGVGALMTSLRAAPKADRSQPPIGHQIENFKLRDAQGKQHSLSDYADKKAIVFVFTGTTCPLSNRYVPVMEELAKTYAPRGVQFFSVNSNDFERVKEIAKHAREFGVSYPVLVDHKLKLANLVHATVTPQAFVLDQKRRLRYAGRIDDRYSSRTREKTLTRSHDLRDALESVLAGRKVAQPLTTTFGCGIVRKQETTSTGPVTYTKHVARILRDNCQECHRPGQIAPFSLTNYREAKNWGREIEEFTASRQMPPWKAELHYGEFKGVRRLPDEDIATLAAWVDNGMPQGRKKDLPPAREWPTTKWRLGTPDLVLTMPEEYELAASGRDVYRCFVLPSGLTEDRDIIAVEFSAGNTRVVHHVLAYLDTKGRARRLDDLDPGPGYTSFGGVGFPPDGGLGGWAPGAVVQFMPKGVGRTIPKGADIIIQVHYHKSGKVERDQTSLGLYFSKTPVERQLRSIPVLNFRFVIPPGAKRHEVRQSIRVPVDVTTYSVFPHMHLLGREMKIWATTPDGKTIPLVRIPDWDFNWQSSYYFEQPIKLPAGTRIDLVAYYDNSADNPYNPNDPPREVRWGEQTTDEMCLAFIAFTIDNEAGLRRQQSQPLRRFLRRLFF